MSSRRWIEIILGLALIVAATAPASAADMGIVTGSEKGTYYQFGLNLQRLMKSNGINLTVSPSKGSVENVFAVYQRPATQLGIVQSDVLAFVARVETDPVLQRIAKKIKMVFPLYNEEIHILGRNVPSFDDLAGKRVAIGREGSGTYLTARLMFKVAEVEPKQMLLIDTDQALAELKAGRIDAMFYVAGAPVKLFTEGVAEADGLALVPVTNKSITEFYPNVELPARSYPWQAQAVPTVAVKSVLVSFDFRRLDCDNVGRFAQILSTNMGWLSDNGHPKWKAVKLDYPLKGWEQYDCVRKYLARTAPAPAVAKSSELNPVMDAIKNILKD
ncbi:MAG TPA: TAXI family TRAP transporter solute-binding subunit [Methylomirabilota bacterium]|jgi:TRAP transporter TAXI family solute receptor|nr:TAXI family TRAP transporter solute-binding subunit [Methylomirabilota bacterium]